MTEAEVRAMRDRVFEKPVSDNEWATCGKNWMAPSEIRFLQEHDWPISEALQRHDAKQQQHSNQRR